MRYQLTGVKIDVSLSSCSFPACSRPDAAYLGRPASSTSVLVKRQAPDKAEGEFRVKENVFQPATLLANREKGKYGRCHSFFQFQFSTRHDTCSRPKNVNKILYHYMAQFDIVPSAYPSPLSPEDPLCTPPLLLTPSIKN